MGRNNKTDNNSKKYRWFFHTDPTTDLFIYLEIHNFKHGTIIRTGITCKKIPLQKSIEFGMVLK